MLGQFLFSFLIYLHISYYKLYFITYYPEKWGKGTQIFLSFLPPLWEDVSGLPSGFAFPSVQDCVSQG